jgi:hypothetical protein
MIKFCQAVAAIMDFQMTQKKQTFGRAPAKEHSSQFCCQMVQWFQIQIFFNQYFPHGAH